MIEKDYSFDVISRELSSGNVVNDIRKILAEKFFSYHFFVSSVKKYIYEYQKLELCGGILRGKEANSFHVKG